MDRVGTKREIIQSTDDVTPVKEHIEIYNDS